MTLASTTNPEQLAEVIGRMAKIGACHSPSFSPDGSRVAFVSDLSGVPFEYLLFPDEGHGVAKAGNRQVATLATVRWFVEHLCNG